MLVNRCFSSFSEQENHIFCGLEHRLYTKALLLSLYKFGVSRNMSNMSVWKALLVPSVVRCAQYGSVMSLALASTIALPAIASEVSLEEEAVSSPAVDLTTASLTVSEELIAEPTTASSQVADIEATAMSDVEADGTAE